MSAKQLKFPPLAPVVEITPSFVASVLRYNLAHPINDRVSLEHALRHQRQQALHQQVRREVDADLGPTIRQEMSLMSEYECPAMA